jgi:hypothetical protein
VFDYPWRPNFYLDADKVELARIDLRIARGEFRVPKVLLRKQFGDALKRLLGRPYESGGTSFYWTRLSGTTVETAFNTSPGGVGQCQYWHRILPGSVDKGNQVRPGEELLLRCSVSDLLGVHITEWDCMAEGDVSGQAALCAQLAKGFIDAAPTIIDGALERDAKQHGTGRAP